MKARYGLVLLLILAGLADIGAAAENTTCTCTCFDGRPLQVCGNPIDAPLCGPEVCPPKPPALNTAPTVAPPRPPERTCKLEAVTNESTGQNEVRLVCR